MANVAKDFAQLISQSKSNKTGPYDTQATVKRVEGNTVWVSIPGGVDETPIDKTVNCTAGDKVQVRVSGGRAWITGNASAPPTDDKTANEAKGVAVIAQTTAVDAKETADAVEGIAQAAQHSADTAASAAASAVTAANSAQSSADNASEYAARALGNLSTVQSVAETLTWITAHGTMALTTDVAPDPTHVYFVVDAGGDYTVGGVTYAIVTEPVTADMGTYYELSIDESLNNYVGTHLALDSEGLWLLPASSGTNKVLIATGAGSTYTTAGTYLIDSGGNTVASFRADGETIGIANGTQSYLDLDFHSMQLTDKEGNAYFYVSDLRDANGEYTWKDIFKGDGNTTVFTLSLPAKDTNYTVTVSDNSGGTPTKTTTKVTFSSAPTNGATINITYITTNFRAKAYTLGVRDSQYTIAPMSVAEGYKTSARGMYSHVEGEISHASGDDSHAEGYYTKAQGTAAHTEGFTTTASANYAHAEGANSTASGTDSHAEGYNTTASALGAHAEGYETTASTTGSHAEGYNTTASGGGVIIAPSHAEGYETAASGKYSHSQNKGTKASSDCQTALGKYNVEDTSNTYAVIVGNGTADNARSDALTVAWTGDVEAAGDIEDGSGNVLSDKADTSAVPTKTSDLANDSGFVSGLITEEKSIKDNVTVNGSGTKYTDGNGSVAKTGYTPLGVVGFRVINASSSGTNGANVVISHAYISGTTAYFRVKNTETSSAKVRIYFTILYAKS